MHRTLRGMAAAALVLVTRTAMAEEPQPPRANHLHYVSGLSFGVCARTGTGVGGVGPCVELPTMGLLLGFTPGVHLLGELGFALAPKGEAEYPALGVRMATGGFGAMARLLAGADLGPGAFVRLGGQVRGTIPLSHVRIGGDFVLELGMRPHHAWELGLRATLGSTGVTAEDATATTGSSVFAQGTLFFVRVVLP